MEATDRTASSEAPADPQARPADPPVDPQARPTDLPARPADLRAHLPGLEPDRRVTDWGRSELVEQALERTVYDFLYHYWFRVQAEGIEKVPEDGPALLLANRAGGLPITATMIAKSLRHRRRLHFATTRSLDAVPGLDMFLTKAGAVPAHPANLHRLLFDEREAVLGFPEGGSARPLRDRYRLKSFEHLELIRAALSARAPIVPVAVLGAEEASPVLASPRWLRLSATAPLPMPAKIRIRVLDPVWRTGGDVETLAADLRALIQENLVEMLAARRSVWLG
jgi:1-acyl-sn-glycerol-3-phosphate acyltransferase